MIQNYLKIAWRNLVRNKLYSLINIGGMAVGMAVAIAIGLWVYDEVSYNHSHENYQQVGQVYRQFTEPLEQNVVSTNWLSQPMAKVLHDKYGHLFKHVVLLRPEMDFTLRVGENNSVKRGQFIDDGVIDMFSLNMVRGGKNSLNGQQSIIISQSTAISLFDDMDPVGQAVKLDNRIDAIITGVYSDIPQNSLFGKIQFFGNFENLRTTNSVLKANENNWGQTSCKIFVQTQDNVSLEQANEAINDLYLKDSPSEFAMAAKKYKTSVWLHPMKDWYLYSEFRNNSPATGRITFVRLFAIIGAFVLLLACINFMNLSTARSEKRAKEVGIRKAIGSMKSQLVNQFLSESFLVVLLAMVLGLVMVFMLLPLFNELADKTIQFPFGNIYFWSLSLGFLIVTSFLAGMYPAFYLSSFQPIKVLKGKLRLGRYAALPRKVMVVTQVTVSIVLIIGTLTVYQQIQYARERPIGYDKGGLIRISIKDPELNKIKLVMKNEILANNLASGIAFSSSPVTAIWDNWGGFAWKGKKPDAESSFTVTWIDEDYGKTIHWNVLDGRDFSHEFGTDEEAVIINQSAARYLGFENPVGEIISRESGEYRRIIGVINDVIAVSPYEQVQAGFYWLDKNPDNLNQMLIKLNPEMGVNEVISKIESLQRKLAPGTLFNYSFVDEEYGTKFKAEQQIGTLASVFAMLAVFISSLGLFGLSSFVAEQRTKEIGVRKVIGASIFNIWSLLSKEFIVLVLISFVIAFPIAYQYLKQWLMSYDYHTEMTWMVFVYAGIGVMTVTMVTVSIHCIKAAIVNPVKSLRSE